MLQIIPNMQRTVTLRRIFSSLKFPHRFMKPTTTEEKGTQARMKRKIMAFWMSEQRLWCDWGKWKHPYPGKKKQTNHKQDGKKKCTWSIHTVLETQTSTYKLLNRKFIVELLIKKIQLFTLWSNKGVRCLEAFESVHTVCQCCTQLKKSTGSEESWWKKEIVSWSTFAWSVCTFAWRRAFSSHKEESQEASITAAMTTF